MSGAERRLVARLSAAAIIAVLLAAPPAALAQRDVPGSFAELAQRLTPAVVNVSTTQQVSSDRGPEMPSFPPGSPFEEFFKDFFDRQNREGQNPRQQRRPRTAQSLGSGFIIDPAGYIVTNNHVVAEASSIKVTLNDDTTLDAKLIGRDTRTDLALLKVETKRPLNAVQFGDSDQARVGDWVLAIGNPFGLGGSVTAGIISARARDINAGPYDDFIQTDASINRGNSGGPLFDMSGRVIGINTAIFSPSGGSVGIGFAIPSAMARTVIDQLKQGGKVRRGWLGVQIQTITEELAGALGLDRPHGALVSAVSDGSPAAAAGFQTGDVVVRVNNDPVADVRRLQRLVAALPIGQAARVTVLRRGKEQRLEVKIGELPDEPRMAAATPDKSTPPAPSTGPGVLGLKLSQVTPDLKKRLSLPDNATGVVVVEVEPGSAAAEKGIRPGDIVREIDREAVNRPEDVAKEIRAATQAGKKSVLVLLERNGNRQFLALPTTAQG